MDYKKILNISLLASVVFSATGYFLLHFSKTICSESYDELCSFGIGKPLLFGFGQLAIIFVILRFFPKQVFAAWLWFGVWYIPLAAIWIVSTPAYGGAFLSPGKDEVVLALGGIYMAVSILIIVIRLLFLKFRRK